jgi:hypothetical protein
MAAEYWPQGKADVLFEVCTRVLVRFGARRKHQGDSCGAGNRPLLTKPCVASLQFKFRSFGCTSD